MTATAPDRAPRTHRLFILAVTIAVVVILADQLTKWWAETALSGGTVIPVIGDVIRFVLVYNPGAAFSIGTGFTWVFAIVAALAVIALSWYAWRLRSLGRTIGLGLVLGGAATHLGDRLFREPGFARGHVVDFIAYGNFFIGNVADIAIVGGAILFVIVMLVEGRRADAHPA